MLLLKPHVHLPLRFVHFWLRLILLSFQFKRSTIFVDVAQSKNMIPIMSELCYATISRKRPTGLDILDGRLRDVPDWVFLWKLPDFCFCKSERALDIKLSFCLTNKIIYLPACSTLPSSSLNMWVPPNIWVMKTTFKTCLSQPLLFFGEVYKTGLETRFLRGSNVILGTLLDWRLDFFRVSSSDVSVKSKLQHPPPPHYGLFRWSNTPTPGKGQTSRAKHRKSLLKGHWMFSFS